MGGGDLNLKKSWHPHTLRNQEKVWKAEQAEKAEKQKLNELQKEITEERNREDLKRLVQTSGVVHTHNEDRKLEWMYKGPSDLLNREEYLLGRTVDKNFEQLDTEEKIEKEKKLVGVTVPKNHVEHECIPFSIRSYQNGQNTEQVDLQRKILEDPLMAIKQKEMESRRKILENPVKLKELHRLLKTEQDYKKTKAEKSRKSKKKKSKKSHKKHNSSDGNSDEDLDALLAKKYKKIQSKMEKDESSSSLDLKKLLDIKYDKLYKELNKATKSKKKSKKSHRSSSSDSDDRYKSRNSGRQYEGLSKKHDDDDKREKQKGHSRMHNEDDRREQSKRNYTVEKQPYNRSDSDNEDDKRVKKNYGLVSSDGKKIEIKNSARKSYSESKQLESGRVGQRDETASKYTYNRKRSSLTEEEKEKRRKEMMENAVWRDGEREQNIKKYREENDKEKSETKKFDRTFINKEMQKALDKQGSVEYRIKSNINNIQRSGRAMDNNFARR